MTRRVAQWRARAASEFKAPKISKQLEGVRNSQVVGELTFDEVDRVWLQRLGRLLTSPVAPAAFVGAGISQALGYPSWPQLLDELHGLAFGKLEKQGGPLANYAERIRDHEDITWRAQEYRDAFANDGRFRRLLRKKFSPRKGRSATLNALVSLPFRHFFTTNYDQELERAYQARRRKPLEVIDWTDAERSADLVSHWSEEREACCIYLHGRFDRPETIILTEGDYQRAYFKTSGNAQRLSAILLLHPVLFVGFSLTDPDLMALLRQANTLCFEGARHYALIGLRNKSEIDGRFVERARLRRKYGVAAIFFDARKNYDGLTRILEYLNQARTWPKEPVPERPPKKITKDYCYASNEAYPNDPLKGRFGGLSAYGKWRLHALVERSLYDPRWFLVRAEVAVRPTSRGRLSGRVDFFVHNSFPQYRYWTSAHGGVARYTFFALGSFTLGVQVHQDNTVLELDLSEIDGAPLDFQFN